MTAIRVALCDDSAIVRDSLASYLAADPSLELVASYGSGDELLRHLPCDEVDVVLLDVRMPGLDGPQVAAALADRPRSPKVLYLSSYPDEIPVKDALTGTVRGALTKDITPEDLSRAIHLAASGASLLSGQVSRRAAEVLRPAPARTPLAQDSRELAVIDLLCQGFTNDQIATRLHRSSSSVKQILGRLCRRANVHSRTELVLYLMDSQFGQSGRGGPRD